VELHAKVSRTTADEAAETIVRGIKRRSKRILVGRDARIIDVVQRAIPVNHMAVMDRLSGGQLRKLHKRS
jgi:butyryl-CoA dehydrogenase